MRQIINSVAGLADFRQRWNGPAVLALLSQFGRMVITWAIGVGKSFNVSVVIAAALKGGDYDLVVALFPTKNVIAEITLPDDACVVKLKGRPRNKCGALDSRWSKLEVKNLGLLGRSELCQLCSHFHECFWPEQFDKKNLFGAQIVVGTHAQLSVNPYFIDTITKKVGAQKVLVIVDEDGFAMGSFRRRVSSQELEMLTTVIESLDLNDGLIGAWVHCLSLLTGADTEFLRCYDWSIPAMSGKLLLSVQRQGVEQFGDDFCTPIYSLMAFTRSPLESREKTENGDLVFSLVPEVDTDFIVYSGTTNPEFLDYRLGNCFKAPFKDTRFEHPETRWYNIASKTGMKKYFPNNSKQILDFYAGLIAKRVSEGKRILLLSKKVFIPFCVEELQARLAMQGLPVKIVTGTLDEGVVSDPKNIPLVNFGIIGVNLFQEFDCVFCLNGYFVNEKLVSGLLQDTLASDIEIPVEITCTNTRPYRRSARAVNTNDRIYDVNTLAPQALFQLEMSVVLQAVGRVRPYTSPAEIITFQLSENPTGYTQEFNTLEEARQFFGVASGREVRMNSVIEVVQAAKSKGLKQRQAAEETGYSLSTIQRHWHRGLNTGEE